MKTWVMCVKRFRQTLESKWLTWKVLWSWTTQVHRHSLEVLIVCSDSAPFPWYPSFTFTSFSILLSSSSQEQGTLVRKEAKTRTGGGGKQLIFFGFKSIRCWMELAASRTWEWKKRVQNLRVRIISSCPPNYLLDGQCDLILCLRDIREVQQTNTSRSSSIFFMEAWLFFT